MGTPTSRGWRLLRAGVFAVVATQLAALGHLLGGGALPDPAVLITVTVFLGGSLSGFADRRRTGRQILFALLASQLAFHLAFSLTAHSVAAHAMTAHVSTSQAMTAQAMAAQAGMHGDSGRMVAFHVVAAAVASWVMTAGESTLFRLFAALHRVLSIAQRPPAIDVFLSWTALIPAGTVGLRRSATALSAASRRGPPRGWSPLPV